MAEQPQMSTALASRARRSVISDAMTGLGMSRGPHISIRGGRFRLIDGLGNEKLIDTHYLDVIIIDANDKPARIMFEGEYDPTSDEPPLCFSDNGTGPSVNAIMPQSPTCMTCQWSVRGTKQTFTGKMTTACENRKKLGVIIPDDPAVNVYEFQIPPGSLSNLKAYGAWLAQQATGYENRTLDVADVVTRVSFDPDKQFVMTFQAIAFADDTRTIELLQYIDENHLSDQAVGRLDQAHDPARVEQMLLQARERQALPRPAQNSPALARAEAQQQPSQFQEMPRRSSAAPQRLNAPRAETAPQAGTAAPVVPAGAQRAPRRNTRATREEAQTTLFNGQNGAQPQQESSAVVTSTSNATASPSKQMPEIPSFLRRAQEQGTQQTLQPSPPRFGVAQAPPPPGEISDALSKAMALPTRRA